IDDLCQMHDRWVAVELVLLDECVEGALLAVVAELDSLHVVGQCPFALGCLDHVVLRHEQEFGVGIDELADEPRACHPVHLYLLPLTPFHTIPPCRSHFAVTCRSSKRVTEPALVHSPTPPAL